jgi:hypothetical protein
MKRLILLATPFLFLFSCKKNIGEKEETGLKELKDIENVKKADHQLLSDMMAKDGIQPVKSSGDQNRAYSYSWFNIPDMPPPYASQLGNTCGSHAAATLLSKWCRDTKGYAYNDYGAKMSPYFIYDNLIYRNIASAASFWYGSTIYNFIRDNGDVNLAWWNPWVANSNQYWQRFNSIGWIAQSYKAPQANWMPNLANSTQIDQTEIKYAVGNLRRPVAIRMILPVTGIQLDGNNNWINWYTSYYPWNQHWMTIWGYDDNARKFNVMNSWGPGWGSSGSFWMPYDAISTFGLEAIRLGY